MKLISEDLGNYFTSLGLSYPIQIMYFVAITEIVCGIFILANKWIVDQIGYHYFDWWPRCS
ncbi:hypothetical protein ACQKCU_11390 [Heyndrickxia sporothermodurans]